MSHLQNYQLVEARNFDEFHATIRRLIGEGWELHGATQVLVTNNFFDLHYYQAMVLLRPEETR